MHYFIKKGLCGMSIKNSVIISVSALLVIFFSSFVLYLYRNQLRLENQWEQSQQQHLFTPISQPSSPALETLVTSAQLWRPVQDRVRDTVIQLFAQVSAIDLLEPIKLPSRVLHAGVVFLLMIKGMWLLMRMW